MDILALFLAHNIILPAVLAFGLGMWIYFEKRDGAYNVTLGAFLVALSFWSFAYMFWRQATTDPEQELYWMKTVYLIGSLLPPLLLLFVLALWRNRMPPTWLQFAVLAPNVLLFWRIYLSGGFLDAAQPMLGNLTDQALLGGHFVAFTAVAIGLLLASARAKGIDRSRLAATLVGSIIAFDSVFAVLFAGAPGGLTDSYLTAEIAMFIGVCVIAVGVIRGHMLADLKLLSSEMFILMALFVLIADIIVAGSGLGFTLRLVVLILLVPYGVLVSRNLVQEAHHVKDLREMSEHIMKINGRLIESDRTKTQFLSLASHQLRAPLGGMRSYLDMMAKGDFGDVSERQKQVLDLNIGVLAQTLETVETFLGLTRLELGKMDLYRTQVNLGDLVRQVVDSVRPFADRKKLALSVDIPASFGTVECDSAKIYHVLLNLVDNAIKYTAAGSIRVYAVREPERVTVRVTDTGSGLGEGEKERLFGMFCRGLAGATMNSTGSGLGLFLAKRLVTAHGGDIIVESAGKGQGSTFGFWLPVRA